MPVTARQLETLIRLSTAMAKARMAKHVDLSDAEKAYELLYIACFKVFFFYYFKLFFRKRLKNDSNLKKEDVRMMMDLS